MKPQEDLLNAVIGQTVQAIRAAAEVFEPDLNPEEIGVLDSVGKGIATVKGMAQAKSEELVLLPADTLGLVFNIDPEEIGLVLLGEYGHLQAGDEVKRTGRVLDVPVGDSLVGRVVDPTGRPKDGKGPVRSAVRAPAERPAPEIMGRAPVSVPLMTGIKVVDALIPIGRGQRELILGDRQTGKTGVAVDTIINQKNKDVLCVYCAIGQRSSGIAGVVADLTEHGAMAYTVVIVAEGDDPPGLRYIAPYTATAVAEYFMAEGRDCLIVYDDLTQHARAYRELSLLLRRPPGREAFPGDIFYIHSRLLERSTRLRPEFGGGSLTALPIVETEAQNISAYIPTNLISITDGQIYLSPDLFQRGILPPVDVGKSVSRVGGKAQLSAYRSVAGDLRLTYSQFEELEGFSRFGTRLDEETRRTLRRGRSVRAVLKQAQFSPLTAAEQVIVLHAVNSGLFDAVGENRIPEAERKVREAITHLPELIRKIDQGKRLSKEDLAAMRSKAGKVLERFRDVRSK